MTTKDDRNLPLQRQASNCAMTTGADADQVGGTHYKTMALQPWDVMEVVLSHEEFIGFLKGNIIKYSMRNGTKPGAMDDGKKALHYKQKLAEVMTPRDTW